VKRGLLAAFAAALVIPLLPITSASAEPSVHPVAEAGYTLGDDVFHPTNFPWPVEMTGQVYYPTDSRHGPYPVVVLLHGRHSTCVVPGQQWADGNWPCHPGSTPIPSHLGYADLARSLAGRGYAVISVSANGINAADSQDSAYGQPARGELVLAHLDLWRKWRDQPGAPIPDLAVRSFDLTRVGLMGHSRGGEGVVNALDQNAQREAPFGIKALLALAPTDFERRVPTGLPIATMLPSCDGDVSDLQGVHYYDDGRYRTTTDRAVRHVITVYGANHNYFNSVWSDSAGLPGSGDDWSGNESSPCAKGTPTRLTEQQQREAGTAYMGAFFRYYLGNEGSFAPLLRGATPSATPANVQVSYHPPSATARRKDINRFTNPRAQVNDLGGAVTVGGQLSTAGCGGDSPGTWPSCLRWPQDNALREPHRGWGILGVMAQRLTWVSTADSLSNAIPPVHGDIRGFAAVQFRAAIDFTSERNAFGLPQDMRIVLTDADGKSASAKAGAFGRGLEYPMTTSERDVVPHLLLNQVRVPLTAFEGIDLSKVRDVRFAFDTTPSGSMTVADLAFTD
jgi:dienelactone hydrolase